MIFIACTATSCDLVLRLQALDVDEADSLVGTSSDWYPDKYPCPNCGERCAISTKADPGSVFTDVTPQEAFFAFSGAGLPEEQECGASAVRELLQTNRISQVLTRHIKGTNRCTLERIRLEDGTILHLGSSAHGACVYRIQRASNYAERTHNSSTVSEAR